MALFFRSVSDRLRLQWRCVATAKRSRRTKRILRRIGRFQQSRREAQHAQHLGASGARHVGRHGLGTRSFSRMNGSKHAEMTPTELRRVGKRLYGEDWIEPMAKVLPVTTRTIRYWLSGERKIRPVIAERILSLETIR